MTATQKQCPRCGAVVPGDTPYCPRAGCGYVYAGRTVQYPPPPSPPPPSSQWTTIQAVPDPRYAAPPGEDNVERNVSMVWTTIGAALAAFFCCGALSGTLHLIRTGVDRMLILFGLIVVALMGWMLSFLLLRWRRLYLAAPAAQANPWEHASRRRNFSVAASLVLAAVLIGAVVAEQRRTAEESTPAAPLQMPAGMQSPYGQNWQGFPPPGNWQRQFNR